MPTSAAPITFFVRDSAQWLSYALAEQCVDEKKLKLALSSDALSVRELLGQRGACFADDIQRLLNLTRQQTHHALWELATAGLAAADGFDQLRLMIDPYSQVANDIRAKALREKHCRAVVPFYG